MKDCTLYVGLDYHQSSVQVCAMDASGNQVLNRSCENNWAAIADAAEAHGRVRRAAIESCAGAADLERVGYLPKVWLAPHDVRELRRVVRFRQNT
ncbi:MAG: hypothetical protein DHS20C16_28310 [Phycisphaerae bacterium]|nr:MAG: hypothetical protein DHS20C16_28310 [Phycisphaerae bacterium]